MYKNVQNLLNTFLPTKQNEYGKNTKNGEDKEERTVRLFGLFQTLVLFLYYTICIHTNTIFKNIKIKTVQYYIYFRRYNIHYIIIRFSAFLYCVPVLQSDQKFLLLLVILL